MKYSSHSTVARSLVPRPSTPPAFDRFQYAKNLFAYWKRCWRCGRPGNEASGPGFFYCACAACVLWCHERIQVSQSRDSFLFEMARGKCLFLVLLSCWCIVVEATAPVDAGNYVKLVFVYIKTVAEVISHLLNITKWFIIIIARAAERITIIRTIVTCFPHPCALMMILFSLSL